MAGSLRQRGKTSWQLRVLAGRDGDALPVGLAAFGALLAVALIAELAWALARSSPLTTFTNTPVTSVQALGRTLFTDYAFQFEVTSVLILVAMLGAVVMARREDQPGGGR